MLTKKGKELSIGIFFVLLSVAAYIYSLTFVNKVKTDVGPAYIPQIISGLLCFLGIIKVIQACRLPKEEKKDSSQPTKESATAKQYRRTGVLTIASIGAYIFLFEPLGFIVDTMLYVFVQSTLFAPKKKETLWIRVGMSLVIPFALYFLFVYAFNLMLPAGILGTLGILG